jgi:hypothetical protein
MLRRALAIVAVAVGLVGFACAADGAGSESVWKEESPEAAEQQLEKMRTAAGKLDRFECDCLVSDLDNTFSEDKRRHFHLYADDSDGFRWEMRPVDLKLMTGRRTASGGPSKLSVQKPYTWVCKGDTCTMFSETQRTYGTMNVGPKSWFAALKTAPHQLLPPWLDPSVDWKGLRSLYKIKRAKSTASEFLVEFSPPARKQVRGYGANLDERLESIHSLIIDRRTNLPKQWKMINSSGTQDRFTIFERIDLKPPKRELKVVLTGYQDERQVAAAAQPNQPPAKDDGEPFQTIQFAACCFRVLTWCPL